MKNRKIMRILIVLMTAVILSLGFTVVFLAMGTFDIRVMIPFSLIGSLISLGVGYMIIPQNETNICEFYLDENSNELELCLDRIATFILRYNNVEFIDLNQKIEDPSYVGLMDVVNDDAQRLATIRVADKNNVLISYVLYFISTDCNIAWFRRE